MGRKLMQINKIELKNISHYARGSEETPCYNATVYINGKKAIEISNDGHGGMDRQHTYPNIEERGLVQKANEWCVKKFGKKSFPYQSDGEEKQCFYDMDLEHICHEELYKWLDAKELKKDLNKKFLFLEDKKSKELRAYTRVKGEDLETFKLYFKGKHQKGVCLNFIPFDDALQIFKECA